MQGWAGIRQSPAKSQTVSLDLCAPCQQALLCAGCSYAHRNEWTLATAGPALQQQALAPAEHTHCMQKAQIQFPAPTISCKLSEVTKQ